MRLEIHTKGFEKTDSVETFLSNAATNLADELLRTDKDVHIKVNVDEDRHRSQSRKPHFFCEVQVKTASSKKWFKTHKASEDFRTAAYDAFHAMKLMLQRRSDKRHDQKIVESAPEFIGQMESEGSEDSYEETEQIPMAREARL